METQSKPEIRIEDSLSKVSRPKLEEAMAAIKECKSDDTRNRAFGPIIGLLGKIIEDKATTRGVPGKA